MSEPFNFFFISESIEELRKDYPRKANGFDIEAGDVVELTQAYFETHQKFKMYEGKTFIVTSIAEEEENLWELSLRGFPFLVWSNEVQLVKSPCRYCGTLSKHGTPSCTKCGAPNPTK